MFLLFFLLFPILIGALARSRGRSFLVWSMLSFATTPIGGLTLLLTLLMRERGGLSKWPAMLGGWPEKLDANKAQRESEAARMAEPDARIEADSYDERVDRLIAERLSELAKAPVPSVAGLGPSSPAGPPVFGKRR